MSKAWIGLDNGISGNIGFLHEDVVIYKHMPVKKCLNYTKAKQWVTRIDSVALKNWLGSLDPKDCYCLLERPMINPLRWKASMSAIRALEATLNVLEILMIPYRMIDSREWQRELLPSGLHKEELKAASLEVGKRLFPYMDFKGFDDADGILLAYFAKLKNL